MSSAIDSHFPADLTEMDLRARSEHGSQEYEKGEASGEPRNL